MGRVFKCCSVKVLFVKCIWMVGEGWIKGVIGCVGWVYSILLMFKDFVVFGEFFLENFDEFYVEFFRKIEEILIL